MKTKIIQYLLMAIFLCGQAIADEVQPQPLQPAIPQPVAVQPTPAQPKVPEKETQKDGPKYQDSNYDRIGPNSIAETLPGGTFTFNDYMLGVLQLSYGINDTTQFSVTATVPVFQFSLMPSLKYQLVARKDYRLAVQVFAAFMRTFFPESEDFTIFGGGAGIYNDVNLDKSGHNILSIGLIGGVVGVIEDAHKHHDEEFFHHERKSETIYGYRLNADSIFLLGKTTKIFFGFNFNHVSSNHIDYSVGSFIFHYGIRLYGKSFATDLGLIRPVFVFLIRDGKGDIIDVEKVMKYMPIGYPFLSFTYKW